LIDQRWHFVSPHTWGRVASIDVLLSALINLVRSHVEERQSVSHDFIRPVHHPTHTSILHTHHLHPPQLLTCFFYASTCMTIKARFRDRKYVKSRHRSVVWRFLLISAVVIVTTILSSIYFVW